MNQPESAEKRSDKIRIIFKPGALLAVILLLLSCVPAPVSADDSTNSTPAELDPDEIPYFNATSDPLEGFNRGAWKINEALFLGVIYPLSFSYNVVVPEPARASIAKAGHNLSFPVRLVNSSLQGKWHGAWEETKRFGVNSTIGLGGLFDPATKLKIGRSNEDFGLTMGHWGSGPWFYLMIPIAGPSNGRDGVGRLADWPLDIAFWIGQAFPDEIWPDTIRPSIEFNNLSDNARSYKQQLDSISDPYDALRILYSLNRQRLIADYEPSRTGDFNPDPTVRAVLFAPQTPNFLEQAKERKVLLPTTGKELRYSSWMQPGPAPLVCYLPGLGSHRLDRSTLAYADMLYRHGYSVVAISNPFQKEFMKDASTVAVPGYGPADCDDVATALKYVVADVESRTKFPITSTALTGVSHGAFFTLMMAARDALNVENKISFDRYVAVNPPVILAKALEELDKMFRAPLAWPADERVDRMREAIYKALYFANNGLDVSGDIPLTREESQFLIGLVFRYTLVSTIMESQRLHNLGVLKHDPRKWVRKDAYREIRRISYEEYMNRFVLPYLMKEQGGGDRQELLAATDLKQFTNVLTGNPKVRVQICEDDFLLTPPDVEWFHRTFGTNLVAYPVGGHLGNLHIPSVQEKLVTLFPPTTEKAGE
ncbi:MAG: MlaA family lipoprotein [Verrucomicrobiota bacterium]